jgi:hypothetical protein
MKDGTNHRRARSMNSRRYKVRVSHADARYIEDVKNPSRLVPAERVKTYHVRAASLRDAQDRARTRFARELLQTSVAGSYWLRKEEMDSARRL